MCMIALVSCGQQKPTVLPIDEDRLVALMADVRIAEEMQKPFITADRDSAMAVYMDSIYQIHKIDSSQFSQVISILEADTKLLESIEVKVHSKLKEMLDEVDL